MGAKELLPFCMYSSSFILLYCSPSVLSASPRACPSMSGTLSSTPLFPEPVSFDSHYLRSFANHIAARSKLVEENRAAVVQWHGDLFRLFVRSFGRSVLISH